MAILVTVDLLFTGFAASTYRSHYRRLPVKLQGCVNTTALRLGFVANQSRRTRSSPIGPAEHEDGGSLWMDSSAQDHRGVFALRGAPPDDDTYRPKSVSSLLMRFKAILWICGLQFLGSVEGSGMEL